jgi:hypothetical protein
MHRYMHMHMHRHRHRHSHKGTDTDPHTNPPQLLKVPHGVFAIAVNEPKFGAQLDNVGNAFKIHLKLPLHIRVPRDVQENGEARGW